MNCVFRFFHNLINARNDWLNTPLYKQVPPHYKQPH